MAKKSSRMRLLLSGALSAVMLATLVPSTASAIGRTDTGSFLTGPYLMTPKTNGMVHLKAAAGLCTVKRKDTGSFLTGPKKSVPREFVAKFHGNTKKMVSTQNLKLCSYGIALT